MSLICKARPPIQRQTGYALVTQTSEHTHITMARGTIFAILALVALVAVQAHAPPPKKVIAPVTDSQ